MPEYTVMICDRFGGIVDITPMIKDFDTAKNIVYISMDYATTAETVKLYEHRTGERGVLLFQQRGKMEVM